MKRFAVVKLLIVGMAFATLSACSEKPDVTAATVVKEDETESEKAARELEESKKELEMMAEAARVAEEKAAMEIKLAAAKKKEQEAKQKRLNEEENSKRALLAKKAAASKARNDLLITKLDKLVTAKGRIYRLVNINRVTPASLGIIHDGGAATIQFSDLSAEWQKKVHYDAVEAADFNKERKAKVKNYKDADAESKKKTQNDLRTASKPAADTAAKREAGQIPEEERKLQALMEKAVSVHSKTEVALAQAFSQRDSYTRGSASWNSADKRLIALQGKANEQSQVVSRYRNMLYVKEEARRKAERFRHSEERRKKKAAAPAARAAR
jgi:hypothetical protein